MKKIYTILLTVLCLGAAVSCDDFLDRKPTNSVDTNTYIAGVADVEVSINGIVRQLLSENMYGEAFVMYGEIKGGDLIRPSRGWTFDGFMDFNHTPTSNTYFSFWQIGFGAIAQINSTLATIEELEKTSLDDFDDVKGQLYTYRGMLYFDLCRLYGRDYMQNKEALAVPIQLKQDLNAVSKRETVAKVYAQALSDLQEGAKTISKDKHNGFMNYYGNLAIQARMYMHMQKYPEALAACEEIMDKGPYALYKGNEWAESWGKQWASESIIEFAVNNEEAGGELAYYVVRKEDDGPMNHARGIYAASDEWLDNMNNDPDDVRWGVMDYDDLLGTIPGTKPAQLYATRHGGCYKMVGGVGRQGDGGKNSPFSCNLKLVRLSEIYLIAAEAALKIGDAANLEKAASYLGAITERSPNLAQPATDGSDVTLAWILSEKSKELFTEGVRFWDMVRQSSYDPANYKDLAFPSTYKKADGKSVALPFVGRDATIDLTTFDKVILPIAESEIRKAGKDVLIQNPGY